MNRIPSSSTTCFCTFTSLIYFSSIPSDPKHREKMRIVTHWASPRVLEKTVSCDDKDDKLINSIVMLESEERAGAVSAFTARKKAHEYGDGRLRQTDGCCDRYVIESHTFI